MQCSWEIVAPVLDASGSVHPYAVGHRALVTASPGRLRRLENPDGNQYYGRMPAVTGRGTLRNELH